LCQAREWQVQVIWQLLVNLAVIGRGSGWCEVSNSFLSQNCKDRKTL